MYAAYSMAFLRREAPLDPKQPDVAPSGNGKSSLANRGILARRISACGRVGARAINRAMPLAPATSSNRSDIRRDDWAARHAPAALLPFVRLARLDRPIGT